MRRAALVLLPVLFGCPERPPSAPPAAEPEPEAAGSTPETTAVERSGGPAHGTSASPGCGRAAPKGGTLHVRAAGRDRAFSLIVPDGYAPSRPYPVVFVLHGGGGSAALARTQTDLERVAAGRAIFVYPHAGSGTWDLDTPAATNPDVALFDAVLLFLHNSLCVDERRVFVTGFSNGAYMANQLACRRGDRIRAVVTHAGGGPYELSGSYDAQGHLVCPGKAVAALVVHGTADGTVAPSEGQKSLDHWAYANRCSGGFDPSPPPCAWLHGCVQPVGACRVPGLGHGLWKEAGHVTWALFDRLR
jgi:polyhydroxybutyrate depolymerase